MECTAVHPRNLNGFVERSLRFYWMRSLSALKAEARIFFEAGLPLMVMGCFVKGLMPGRSFVAGFFIALSLRRPGITNSPGPRESSCFLMISVSSSNTLLMLFLSSSVSSASSDTTCDLVNLLPAISGSSYFCSRQRPGGRPVSVGRPYDDRIDNKLRRRSQAKRRQNTAKMPLAAGEDLRRA